MARSYASFCRTDHTWCTDKPNATLSLLNYRSRLLQEQNHTTQYHMMPEDTADNRQINQPIQSPESTCQAVYSNSNLPLVPATDTDSQLSGTTHVIDSQLSGTTHVIDSQLSGTTHVIDSQLPKTIHVIVFGLLFMFAVKMVSYILTTDIQHVHSKMFTLLEKQLDIKSEHLVEQLDIRSELFKEKLDIPPCLLNQQLDIKLDFMSQQLEITSELLKKYLETDSELFKVFDEIGSDCLESFVESNSELFKHLVVVKSNLLKSLKEIKLTSQ